MPNPPRILLLDDETALLERYRVALTGLRARPVVETCNSGARALALLESENFNLLVTDLDMPGMDGLQVATIVRRKFPQLRLVVMTSGADPAFPSRAYGVGVDLVWEKPGVREELGPFQSCIESLLDEMQPGGFQGVQTKSLVDLVQLECLSRSSSLLRLTNGDDQGLIWINQGEVFDAELGDLSGEAAFNRILHWTTGNFEILPAQPEHPRRIDISWQGLLLNTAQEIDESRQTGPETTTDAVETALWHSLASTAGVEFVTHGPRGDSAPLSRSSSSPSDPQRSRPEAAALDWARRTWNALDAAGQNLGLGRLAHIEGLGHQRHVGVVAGSETIVCLGFHRKLSIEQVRATTRSVHPPA